MKKNTQIKYFNKEHIETQCHEIAYFESNMNGNYPKSFVIGKFAGCLFSLNIEK